ncbi:MAG: molybdopterin-binding protein [Natronomonas sp.]
MDVAVVTVGDELLSGDTVNTNAAWLGSELTSRGANVERVTVVPDRIEDISDVVRRYAEAYDAVIVTGGIGPTHDDVTVNAVAEALDRPMEQHEAVLSWLESEGGYSRGDLTDGTAELPAGSRPLHNRVGVAPGCVVEDVYVLPGVPAEMKGMFETVADEFSGRRRHAETVSVDEPESMLIDRFEELEAEFDVTVGSYPGEYVRVKIQANDEETASEAAAWLRQRVELWTGDDDNQ